LNITKEGVSGLGEGGRVGGDMRNGSNAPSSTTAGNQKKKTANQKWDETDQ
jgi:hypothetical protein